MLLRKRRKDAEKDKNNRNGINNHSINNYILNNSIEQSMKDSMKKNMENNTINSSKEEHYIEIKEFTGLPEKENRKINKKKQRIKENILRTLGILLLTFLMVAMGIALQSYSSHNVLSLRQNKINNLMN